MNEELDSLLSKYYYDVGGPASYASAEKLYHIVNAEGKKVGRYKIRRWLNSQDNYSLQKTPRRSFKRIRVYTTGMNNLWDADLMDLKQFSKENENFKYVLVVVDCFSRYLWLQPLKNKTGETKSPLHLKRFSLSNGVRHFSAQNELHANYAERVLQTIKNKIFRFFTKNRTHRYINNLQNFAKSYNGTPHRSLQNIAPKDVNSVNESDIWGKMYLSKTEKKPKEIKVQTNKKKRRKKQFKYKIGSLVRLSNIAHIFDRSYSQRWTEEIFKVVQRFRQQNIDLYRLSNIKGDEFIRGTFYDSELQRVEKDENSLWIIEKIIKKRKRRGKTEYLVRFQGWPPSYDEYIPAEQIQSLS
ncbi:Hypothetical predicted protein [Mytilus galloprovincialis]|uniref:Chromo domain-containing protein n=1 Tax=Mytilus galloprovincialis TaxID=29158 RepID=A0A8B6HNQ8_MYTGA|nr:Hypothetical predicted protein [Mytilus galloprovincialis]